VLDEIFAGAGFGVVRNTALFAHTPGVRAPYLLLRGPVFLFDVTCGYRKLSSGMVETSLVSGSALRSRAVI